MQQVVEERRKRKIEREREREREIPNRKGEKRSKVTITYQVTMWLDLKHCSEESRAGEGEKKA